MSLRTAYFSGWSLMSWDWRGSLWVQLIFNFPCFLRLSGWMPAGAPSPCDSLSKDIQRYGCNLPTRDTYYSRYSAEQETRSQEYESLYDSAHPERELRSPEVRSKACPSKPHDHGEPLGTPVRHYCPAAWEYAWKATKLNILSLDWKDSYTPSQSLRRQTYVGGTHFPDSILMIFVQLDDLFNNSAKIRLPKNSPSPSNVPSPEHLPYAWPSPFLSSSTPHGYRHWRGRIQYWALKVSVLWRLGAHTI